MSNTITGVPRCGDKLCDIRVGKRHFHIDCMRVPNHTGKHVFKGIIYCRKFKVVWANTSFQFINDEGKTK